MKFAANSALLIAVSLPVAGPAQDLLFSSGFESDTTLLAPAYCWPTGCWQEISRTDGTTGQSWSPGLAGATAGFFLFADAPVDADGIHDYMFNQVVLRDGRLGTPTRTLFSSVTQSGCCAGYGQGAGATQNVLQVMPASEPGDLYISYWSRLQEGLTELMQGETGWNWRSFFSWKTAGDYRVVLSIETDPNHNGGAPFWQVTEDNAANCHQYYPPEHCPAYARLWETPNFAVAVPEGEWFKFEVFWHRSGGPDGRIWMAVDGQVIYDRMGGNLGDGTPDSPRPINRIYLSSLYSSTAYPIYQWTDDLQVWNGYPYLCSDPPCAPH